MRQDTPVPSFTRPMRPLLVMLSAFFICSVTVGMSIGHSAVLLPELQSANSSLFIDEDMGSWIVSVYAIVSPLGAILGGLSIDAWGRKKICIIGNMTLFFGWLLIVCAQNPVTILIGRMLEGISRNQLSTCITVLMDEILDPKSRVTMFCGVLTFLSAGIIAISCLGTFLHWRTASGVATFFSFISFVLFFYIRESPMWLIRKKQKKKAEDVLRYLWGPGKESQAKGEMADIIVKLRLEDVAESSSIRRKILSWGALILEPRVFKPFLILHFFNIMQVFCGLHLFTYYSIDILSRMSNGVEILDGNVTNIIISILRTLTNFLMCFVSICIGRRKLCITSGLFSCVSALGLGLVLLARYISQDPLINDLVESYIIFTLVIIFVVSMTFGFAIFPSVMIGETQTSCIRGLACGYIYTINEVVLGGVLKMYPRLMHTLQIHGLFLMFGISCAICTIFVYLFLPETQGLALQDIEEYFRQPNILWITRKTLPRTKTFSEKTGDNCDRKLLETYGHLDEL